MKKQKNLGKNSFTLIETLLSLVIISIILGGFYTLINQNNDFKTYNTLQKAQNDFISNDDINNTSYNGIKFFK